MINLVSKVLAIDLTLLQPRESENITDVSSLITIAVNWVGIIAGVMAFFYLVYSGILYLTAAGNAENAKKGQQGIINAIIGIIVILGAWIIVQAIAGSVNFDRS